jgi:hypothetical protein
MTHPEMLPGLILFLVSIVAGVTAFIDTKRFYTWLSVYSLLFVLSDVIDLILVGAESTPLQRSLGVPPLIWVIGRATLIGLIGLHWRYEARRERRMNNH